MSAGPDWEEKYRWLLSEHMKLKEVGTGVSGVRGVLLAVMMVLALYGLYSIIGDILR